jgi:hypothetical protein
MDCDTYSQKKDPKWTGGVAQAVENLLCKCEAPSSNLRATNKKFGRNYVIASKLPWDPSIYPPSEFLVSRISCDYFT